MFQTSNNLAHVPCAPKSSTRAQPPKPRYRDFFVLCFSCAPSIPPYRQRLGTCHCGNLLLQRSISGAIHIANEIQPQGRFRPTPPVRHLRFGRRQRRNRPVDSAVAGNDPDDFTLCGVFALGVAQEPTVENPGHEVIIGEDDMARQKKNTSLVGLDDRFEALSKDKAGHSDSICGAAAQSLTAASWREPDVRMVEIRVSTFAEEPVAAPAFVHLMERSSSVKATPRPPTRNSHRRPQMAELAAAPAGAWKVSGRNGGGGLTGEYDLFRFVVGPGDCWCGGIRPAELQRHRETPISRSGSFPQSSSDRRLCFLERSKNTKDTIYLSRFLSELVTLIRTLNLATRDYFTVISMLSDIEEVKNNRTAE
ncbi:hypothetical protein EDC01DRAFT_626121 [Geopyxis carbonaria]|nr:hypothetical protein EDC01DRAFT_626121 [Geopyxis carbonaria]